MQDVFSQKHITTLHILSTHKLLRYSRPTLIIRYGLIFNKSLVRNIVAELKCY